jgi:hypothetical protein
MGPSFPGKSLFSLLLLFAETENVRFTQIIFELYKISNCLVIVLPSSLSILGIILLVKFFDSSPQKYFVGFSPSSIHCTLERINYINLEKEMGVK